MKNSIQFGKKYCKSQYYYAGLFDTFSSGLIKQSVECIFDNMALHFECRINKNEKRTLSDCFFWRFCPLGYIKTDG